MLSVCDTSSIYNFGKTSIFKKLRDSVALTSIVSIKNSKGLKKLAMLVFISLKGCICHMSDCHKPEKEIMMKWPEQTVQKSTHHCYNYPKSCILPWTSCVASN